ncbi:MAG: Rne/Rng family ribonuclease [Vampirovibrio sp.]|nr:Rne/Rng family ribonuclease [Vampirovibrio sp.]
MGKRRIIVSERDNLAALFDGDQAIEFIINRGDMLLGDVYLSTVENILPSIEAAFVNVGGEKMGFLHSSDVAGKGDLKARLQPKQQLVVQVMKEPTGHKGPRVTTNISLPGRFLVLMPESKGISISRKIESAKERARLKSTVSLQKPPGVGVIIRTEAEGQKESDVQEDFETLMERWQHIVAAADTSSPPSLLYRDQDLLYRVIRECVTEDVEEIMVDSSFGQQRTQQLLQNWNLEKSIKVTTYSGNQPIVVGTGVDKEIKMALQTKVPLPSGGYLYIQPTEALTVIDVNSGKFTSLDSQAATIRQTNLESCKEIARQLRLRNIGGMIIVDFIDMESRADQLTILEAFETELADDKAKPQIGQLSDLGLVEMTRHRQGQALAEIFTKKCTNCAGNGHAIEDLHWGTPFMASEQSDRRGGRHQHHRGRGGHVPRPAAAVNNQHKGMQSNKIMQGKRPVGNQRHLPKPAVLELPTGFLKNGVPQPSNKPDTQKRIDEYLKDKMYKEYSTWFSMFVKMVHTPPGANSILARINPKTNDILTLVHSIEDGVPISDEYDDRRDSRDSSGRRRPQRHGSRMAGADDEDESDDSDMDVDPEEDMLEDAVVSASDVEDVGESDAEDQDPESSEEEEASDGGKSSSRRAPASRSRRGRPTKSGTRRTANAKDDVKDETKEEHQPTDDIEDSDTPIEVESAEEEKPKRRRGRPPKRQPAKVQEADDVETDQPAAETGGDNEESSQEREVTTASTSD